MNMSAERISEAKNGAAHAQFSALNETIRMEWFSDACNAYQAINLNSVIQSAICVNFRARLAMGIRKSASAVLLNFIFKTLNAYLVMNDVNRAPARLLVTNVSQIQSLPMFSEMASVT